jgi:hypothetical protein
MEVLLESEDQMARNGKKRSGKRRRPNGPPALLPATVADETGEILKRREAEWLERLAHDPASFAAVEREVHDQAQRQADRYIAGLLEGQRPARDGAARRPSDDRGGSPAPPG